MIKIKTPSHFKPEKEYIIDIIFNEFLGLKYSIDWKNTPEHIYEISLENGKRIVIPDSFFKHYKSPKDYLKLSAIPENVSFIENHYLPEKDLPVIFGNADFKSSKDGIECGTDIFSSVFFMLTRWEEKANPARDNWQRFPAQDSLAYRFGFLSRPVVDEYIKFLWNMLKALGYNSDRKQTLFEVIPTHDVDLIDFRKIVGLKMLAGDLIKRRSFHIFFHNLKYAVKREDPYNTFDWLMDLSEKHNLKSRFYFMSGGNNPNDGNYDLTHPALNGLFDKINKRRHIIGFHPSFDTYKDPETFIKEKTALEKKCGNKITEGRQHCLRFEVPVTWRVWQDAGMKTDCTLGYSQAEGFRCGTAREYPVFDFENQTRLELRELPLIAMDGTLNQYRRLSINEARESLCNLKDKCRKYRIPFTILFHNSSFDKARWKGYRELYEYILRY